MIKFIRSLINGRLFGHPVHMMLVHFPSALLPFSAVLALLAFIRNDDVLALFNFYVLSVGTVIGWMAIIFGIIDLVKLQENKDAFKTGLIHGGLNTLWISVFSVIGGIQIKYYPLIPVPSIAIVVIEAAVFLSMLYSNHLGGRLVLKFGAGR
jgi:uncharacterized membrane protein